MKTIACRKYHIHVLNFKVEIVFHFYQGLGSKSYTAWWVWEMHDMNASIGYTDILQGHAFVISHNTPRPRIRVFDKNSLILRYGAS